MTMHGISVLAANILGGIFIIQPTCILVFVAAGYRYSMPGTIPPGIVRGTEVIGTMVRSLLAYEIETVEILRRSRLP